MKYGLIAGNKRINDYIYRCFDYIHEADVRMFVKKFGDQLHDNVQVMHTFRELVLGAYLASNEFKVRYDNLIDSFTPDWCNLDESLNLNGIAELTNFHTDKDTDTEIKEALKTKGVWAGWMPPNDDRLYQIIWGKSRVYKALVEKYRVSYVIAVFSEFTAGVVIDELHSCLFHDETGLFALYPTTSGVLFFEEKSGRYEFTYLQNPHADREIYIKDGTFL
jgi:hypothetical protein